MPWLSLLSIPIVGLGVLLMWSCRGKGNGGWPAGY